MFYVPPAITREQAINMAKTVLFEMGGKDPHQVDQAVRAFASVIEGIERHECIKLLRDNINNPSHALDQMKRRQ